MDTKTKRYWTMHRSGGLCGVGMQGDNLIDAIESNFDEVAREAGLGNAAGYALESVTAEYRGGILGGKGGVVVTLRHKGLRLAHRRADQTLRTSTVWIHAAPEDLPEPHAFLLHGNDVPTVIHY